jgi:hypothetical protein
MKQMLEYHIRRLEWDSYQGKGQKEKAHGNFNPVGHEQSVLRDKSNLDE